MTFKAVAGVVAGVVAAVAVSAGAGSGTVYTQDPASSSSGASNTVTDTSLAGCITMTASSNPNLNPEQLTVAKAAVNGANLEGTGVKGALIAVTAGLVESDLRNLNHGDRDSLGPWQMRPSQGWGTPVQLIDLSYTSRKFQQVLKGIHGWESMDPGTAAAAVEQPAEKFAFKYGLRVEEAKQIVAVLGGQSGQCVQAPAVTGPATGKAKIALAWAVTQAGGRYVFGGNGPQDGGYDCSSFVIHAVGLAGLTGLPRTAEGQRQWFAAGHGVKIPYGQERPGDIIFWDSYLGPGAAGHVMLINDPSKHQTIEAHDTAHGILFGDYSKCPRKAICDIYRPNGW